MKTALVKKAKCSEGFRAYKYHTSTSSKYNIDSRGIIVLKTNATGFKGKCIIFLLHVKLK